MDDEVSEFDFTVYERISGAWVKNLSMLRADAIENIDRSKHVLVEGDYRDDTYYQEGVIMACGEKPHYWAKWSNQTGGWVDSRSQDEIDDKVKVMIDENKAKRNKLLLESDWTLGEDSPLDEETKDKWRLYRQQLRDMTYWVNPTFPEKP